MGATGSSPAAASSRGPMPLSEDDEALAETAPTPVLKKPSRAAEDFVEDGGAPSRAKGKNNGKGNPKANIAAWEGRRSDVPTPAWKKQLGRFRGLRHRQAL